MINGFYEDLGRLFRSRRFLFLNYGYSPNGSRPFRWVRPEDRPYRYHLALARQTLAGINLRGKSVLEVGCGRGGNCYYMARYAHPREIFGVDVNEANVALCRRLHGRLGALFVRGDAQSLPFASASFDLVLSVESSHCYPRLDDFLAEAGRVLKPGGILAYSDFWRLPIFPWDWKQREEQVRSAGLELLSEEDLTEGVFEALKHKDGLSGLLEGLRTRRNSPLLRRILEANEAMRLALASHLCRYRILRLRQN